jgi:transposase
MHTKLSNEDRERIIASHLRGTHPSKIAMFFNCSESAIRKIIKIYNDEGRVDKKQKGGSRRVSLTVEHKNLIKSYIEDNCSITLMKI